MLAAAALPAASLFAEPIGPTGEWRPSGPPAFVFSIAASRGLQPLLYAASTDGISRSPDIGASWTLVNSQFSDNPLSGLAVDPNLPNTIYASRGGAGGVLKSVDGGANWTPVNAGLPLGFWKVTIDPVDHLRLYAGGSNGIYLSTDGAMTWTRLPLSIFYVTSITVDSTDSRRVYATGDVPGNPGSVFASSDRGETWRTTAAAGDSISALAIDPTDPSTLYVSAYCCRTLWRSDDFGHNWLRLQAPTTFVDDLGTDPSGFVYSAGSQGPTPSGPFPPEPRGVFWSADRGKTWSDLNNGLAGNPIGRLLIDPAGAFLVALPLSKIGTFVLVVRLQQVSVPTLSSGATLLLTFLLSVLGLWFVRGLEMTR